MTAPKIARPIMKAKTPRVPRSSRSKPVSWPEWPWFISSLMRRLQKSQRLRRVHRQQRTRSQVVEEVGHPKTADPGNDREMHPADVKRGMRRRLNMPKNIDDAHDYEPRSEPDQTARFALQLAREQERERHGEMEHHEKQADVLPPAIHAAHVPRNFFRQVARPDDEPLRKIEVRPDHDEGEHELAVVWAYFNFSQWLIIWAGNLPEEIPWYVRRMNGGWEYVGLFLVVFHFAVPFALLLSRQLKRKARSLVWLASGLIIMRIVDIFWHIEPASHPTFHVSWVHFAIIAGIGGLWMTYFFHNLRARPLLAVNAPQTLRLLEPSHE